MPVHLLKIIRGFAIEGPTNLVLRLLRAWSADDLRVSLVSLSDEGPLRPEIEREITRLGGTVAI
ncbi:MAG: hypothetical protein ABI579_04795, partial [Candidatus Sumerlaeota bacterium]